MTRTSARLVLHSALSVWEQVLVARNAWRPNSCRSKIMLALTSVQRTNMVTSPLASAVSVTRTFASLAVMALIAATVLLARDRRHSWTASVQIVVDQICTRKMVAALETVGFRCTRIRVTSLAYLALTNVLHVNSSRGNPCAQSALLLLCKTRLAGHVARIALLENMQCLT